MKKYEKPVVMINEELAEGVYAGSGCFKISDYTPQEPVTGRETYVIGFNAKHEDTHKTKTMLLTLTFNQPVEYVSSGWMSSLYSGNNTNVLVIKYAGSHDINGDKGQNVGLSDIQVKSDAGLQVLSTKLECIDCFE